MRIGGLRSLVSANRGAEVLPEIVLTTGANGPQPTAWTPKGNVIWDNTGKYATDGAAAAGVVASRIPGQAGSWTSGAIAVTPGAVYSTQPTNYVEKADLKGVTAGLPFQVYFDKAYRG